MASWHDARIPFAQGSTEMIFLMPIIFVILSNSNRNGRGSGMPFASRNIEGRMETGKPFRNPGHIEILGATGENIDARRHIF